MTLMAPEKLIPLKDAPWAFASQRLRSARYAAQKALTKTKLSQMSSDEMEARRKRASEDRAEAIKLVAEGFNEIIEGWRTWSAPELAMQEHLLQKLRDGKLVACGVQSAPKQKRHLEVLPEHFFVDAKINWDGNKVTNFGVTYSAVRVRRRLSYVPSQSSTEKALKVTADVSSSALARPADQKTSEANATPANAQTRALTLLGAQESAEAQRQKPGPPSGAEVVIATYEELRRTGVIKDGMTIKDICRKLVRVLKSNTKAFPNGRGLSYASIARHLRPHLTGLSKFAS